MRCQVVGGREDLISFQLQALLRCPSQAAYRIRSASGADIDVCVECYRVLRDKADRPYEIVKDCWQ